MSCRGSLSSRMLPRTLRSASRFWGGSRSLGEGDPCHRQMRSAVVACDCFNVK